MTWRQVSSDSWGVDVVTHRDLGAYHNNLAV
jgi:hypothetical protein